MISAQDGEDRIAHISRFVVGFLEKQGKPIFWGQISLTPDEVADPDKCLPVVLGYAMQLVAQNRAQSALQWFRGLKLEDEPEGSSETLAGMRLRHEVDEHHDLPAIAPMLHLIQEAFHQALTPKNTYDLSRFATSTLDPIVPKTESPVFDDNQRIR